jgi:two-component system sensor histidine kinase CreC
MLRTRGISGALDAPDAITVTGERFLLTQAIGNLLQNALEFTPVGGSITLSLRASSDGALVTVDDTGPGLPDFALPRLFERFYSLPRPDTGAKSTGLGLSFVREVAHLHGGEISLENRPAGGTRATFSLAAIPAV